MVRVVWTRRAAFELRSIRAYIADFSPRSAERLATRLISATRDLESYPERGRAISRGRCELTIVPPYLIRYVVTEEVAYILDVRHGAREPD